MPHRLVPALLLAMIAPLPALAQTAAVTSSVPAVGGGNDTGWAGTGELGFSMSRGNTENDSFVGKLNFAYSSSQWKHSFGASTQYAKDDGEETARRYELFDTSGFRVSDRSYIWGSVRNERDHYTSYEYQWSTAIGYGYEAIKTDKQHLTLEAGPGYRWSKDQGVQVHHNEAIARGLADYSLQLTPTTSLVDTFLVESGSDNTFLKNLFGLQVAMTEKLALKAGLETRHNTEVDEGTKKTDNLTTVNIVYNFK
ncbi:DUF481 domain-containing protein [Pseudoxanthomonas sp. JBR18]|uniref:DUF481 domain-containing protein n=1 Tax=Pseudoxanthomonas sp. JBR18 TaxID=2969308 RepID=UPI002305CC43|nr:DUF481 domain-containing protein [Pseudoxanthomonas sp. JBR18]WCE05039.1 DUF481 domain-containing protein [Pseudoxanthomonas sp. JBR18]